VEVMDLEPPQQCLPLKNPTWTMWRSEGQRQGKSLLRNRFDDTNDTNDTRDMSYSFQEGLNAVKEKFEDLSTSKIDDLSTGEIGELIESIKNVEEESIKQAEEDLIMKVSKVIPNNHDQSVINVSKNVSKEKDVENVEFISYEQGIAAVSDRFQNISNVKVDDLTKNEINDLVSSLDSLQEASYRKEEEKIEEKLNEGQEIKNDMYSKQCEEIVQVKEEVIDIKEDIESSYLPVNSTLAPYISPLPVAPPLSPIHLPGIRAGEAISPLALSSAQVLRSCLRGKESVTTDRRLGWKEEAELWWFPRQQGWVSVPREGGNTLGMEAAHCLKEEVKVALGEEEQEQADTTDHSATDQSTLSSCSGVTMTKSRSSPRLLQAQSSSSSGYSSASSSTTSSSALLQPSSIKEDPDEIDSYNSSPPTFSCPAPPPKDTNSKKSMKKATRSSSRLSMAPVVFGSQSEEWRSQSTKPGVLKLSRVSASTSKLPSLSSSAMDCSSNSAPNSSLSSSISSLSKSSSMLNSSRGELGTRGLSRVNSRQRKQILKQAGAQMDPTEGEMLKEIRESRLRANCGCNCKGECKEETCECVQSGVTCHEEEPGEPCACTHQLCNNPSGRYRFDRTQVKMHFAEVKMGIVCLN